MYLPWILQILLALTLQLQLGGGSSGGYCDEVDDQLVAARSTITGPNSTVRKVDLINGVDVLECLNKNRTSNPPPCGSLEYALHGDGYLEGVTSDVALYVGPGVYRSNENTTRLVETQRVAFIGAGTSKTIIVCGANGTEDSPCAFPNFQVRNSSHVLIAGVTFTGCGPVTSPLYTAFSDYIFIENCTFENNTSPASLFYNTPNVRISNTSFIGNHPEQLNETIVHSVCYRPLGDLNNTFFLDNRTSGGAISYYSEDATVNMLVQDGLFMDNNALPDQDVGLVRRSKKYGHGGALSIRLLNGTDSRICIRDSKFYRNFAEAHAGAFALTIADSTDSEIVVLRSTFWKNRCQIESCTGGAVGIYLFSSTKNNSMMFQDCNFTSNEAKSSGAVVLSTSVSAGGDIQSDILEFTRCHFQDNRAFFEGTALGVFSLTHTNLIGIPVVLDSCYFYLNNGTNGSIDTTAVTVYRVLLTLLGNTTFQENIGGGATLLSSRLDVRGKVLFDQNRAVFGAGVAMAGRSLILLHEGSSIVFSNNSASQQGAGLYVEDPSSDFTLSILNTGCFIRYNSSEVDIPPNTWKTSVVFTNNRAEVAGAAIYANDMSRCQWVGSECGLEDKRTNISRTTIFDLVADCSPFKFSNNTVGESLRGQVVNPVLATDPRNISAKSNYSVVGYGETVAVSLSSVDDQGNFREAVWSVSAPSQPQSFGAVSSDNTIYSYTVPSKLQLLNDPDAIAVGDDFTNFSITFSLLLNESLEQSFTVHLMLSGNGCHPGYLYDNKSHICMCLNSRQIIRCDQSNRYFFARDGLWVGVENQAVSFANIIPGFLNCQRAGALPGCKYEFDNPDRQCAKGRQGTLCGRCNKGYGVTFDLRSCENCNAWGSVLFVCIIIIFPIMSLAILYLDIPLPNELKGVIFYAQVVGVIYRSTPYLTDDQSFNVFFDFTVNMLGLALPFPLCMHENLDVLTMAILGYVPPLLALLTAIAYWFCARHCKFLSHREQYGFHGFYFLLLIIYKYIIDTSFILVSCTEVYEKQVFLYQGEIECYKYPFVLLLVLGSVMLVIFGVVLPLYVLKLIYAPGKMIFVRNALTHGLKNKRRYLWYGVWDIWRRLLFVAASLFISVTTRSVVLLIQSVLILFCLWVLCFVRPYKKYYINMLECLMILALFSTTLSVYDRENDFHVGRRVGYVTFSIPYVFAIGFIFYRILSLIQKRLWPRLMKLLKLESKLERAKKKCNDIAEAVRGRTLVLVGEPDDGQATDDIVLSNNRRSGADETFSAELRETLLDEGTTT